MAYGSAEMMSDAKSQKTPTKRNEIPIEAFGFFSSPSSTNSLEPQNGTIAAFGFDSSSESMSPASLVSANESPINVAISKGKRSRNIDHEDKKVKVLRRDESTDKTFVPFGFSSSPTFSSKSTDPPELCIAINSSPMTMEMVEKPHSSTELSIHQQSRVDLLNDTHDDSPCSLGK